MKIRKLMYDALVKKYESAWGAFVLAILIALPEKFAAFNI